MPANFIATSGALVPWRFSWEGKIMRKHLGRGTLVFYLLLITTPAVWADKVLELKAANYNPCTFVWSDTSGNGNDATATFSPPTLNPGQTPNGSAVVTFDVTNWLWH